MINYVLGFAFNKDKNRVALIRKNRPEWQAGLLNGIGGKIEETDKSYVKAMIREFKEETGYSTDINDWQNYFILGNPDWQVNVFRMFNCDLDKLRSKTDEKIEIVYIDILHSKPRISNLDWLIPLALDNKNSSFGELNYK